MRFREYSAKLVVPFSVAVVVMLAAGMVQAGTEYTIADGDNGILYVNGELTHGACNIETSSRWQTINMGNVTTDELVTPGGKGHATAVHLHLLDCTESGPDEAENQNGTTVRVVDQPEVRISFESERDANNSGLFAVQGAGGFGLRLEDTAYHNVVPGARGEPLVIEPGSDELTYWLIPERTRAPLQEGAWHSVINMKLSYE